MNSSSSSSDFFTNRSRTRVGRSSLYYPRGTAAAAAAARCDATGIIRPLVFHGYEEVQPTKTRCEDGFYFPITAARNQCSTSAGANTNNTNTNSCTIGTARKNPTKNQHSHGRGDVTVAITIPCYNEEAESLRRTLKSLSEQELPKHIRLETVIVMDGAAQIPKSMISYLEELFQLEPTLEPFFGRFEENVNTVIIEPAFEFDPDSLSSINTNAVEKGELDPSTPLHKEKNDDGSSCKVDSSTPTLHLSLVVKRNNQRKVNSQMWALASHAKACNCDFVFLTDCGTAFHKECLRFLLEPMLQDKSIGVTSGYQRGMSAELQDCGKYEWWHNPGNFILRQGQIFDHELAYSSSKGLHNRLGFLPVVPGPCGLYRYDCLGSLESGVMKEYFELSTCTPKTSSDLLILGNTQLAEDRFPPILLSLQTKRQCKVEGTTSPCPRAYFVPDAIYYFEAEIPLESLVKQRRRWNNGSFFSALWFLSSDWLWQSNHSSCFKVAVLFASGCESIVVSIFFAIFMPPTTACSLYGATRGYLGGDIKAAFEDSRNTGAVVVIDLKSTALALIPSLAYMLAYTIFLVGHIPRAVPVKQHKDDGVKPKQRQLQSRKSDSSQQTKWRADRRSAFRPALWRLAMCTNVLASLCIVPWMIIALIYHLEDISTMRWCIFISMVVFYASAVSGICERQKPSLRAIWNLVVRFPLMLGLGGFSIMNWCQCYSFARTSDLSWGNRAGAHEEENDGSSFASDAVKRRAHLGKLFAFSLLFCNFVCYAGFTYWTIFDNRAVLYLVIMILTPSSILMSLHGMASLLYGLHRLVSFVAGRCLMLLWPGRRNRRRIMSTEEGGSSLSLMVLPPPIDDTECLGWASLSLSSRGSLIANKNADTTSVFAAADSIEDV